MKDSKLVDWFFFFGLFLLFLLPPTDPDLGWHLRCGQEIWLKKGFCSQNQFAVFAENYSWSNNYWLYQVAIFPFFTLAGFWGLTIFNASVASLGFVLFYLAIKNYSWEKMIAIILTLFLGWGVFSFGIRSQLLGFFYISLLLWLFSRIGKHPKVALLFPLIMFTWANSHGSVVVGLVLLLFFWLKEIIACPRRFFPPTVIFLVSSLVTLLNPFGFQVYNVAWQHFGVVNLGSLIAEWVPPVPAIWWLIFLSTLGLFFYLLSAPRKEEIILAFLILPFTVLALKARRNVPFYLLVSAYLFLSSRLTQNILAFWLRKKELRANLAELTTALLLAFGLFIRLPLTVKANLSWQSYCQNSSLNYPCQAIEFLKNQSEKGNIFNRYEWGGFLIWQLPKFKVFVDGRMPAWPTPSGKSPYTIYLETLQTQPGWQETLASYKINWILISPGTFMDLKLSPGPQNFGWQEVYRDKISVIYKRKTNL